MPNTTFNSFVSNYRQSITCKKIEFATHYSELIERCLKILIEDGYIKNFYYKNNWLYIEGISLQRWLAYNRIVLYSTTWKSYILTYKKLLMLVNTGGYFLISTQQGVMNDQEARWLKLGGVILFGIF